MTPMSWQLVVPLRYQRALYVCAAFIEELNLLLFQSCFFSLLDGLTRVCFSTRPGSLVSKFGGESTFLGGQDF